ncbi:hypothetical protein CLOP_g3551 [Closterium sp. NIES-67]|nr:hypothetical protein CLOP_g3551 [Closterium sp. NIES-67]
MSNNSTANAGSVAAAAAAAGAGGAGGAASVEEEVAGLDRLLTRLALTDDAKLEKVLSKLLPLALSRLASPHDAARKKVMEMLAHINKRVRGASSIHLPLSDLLALYCSATGTPINPPTATPASATPSAPSATAPLATAPPATAPPSSSTPTAAPTPPLPSPHPLTASFALVYTDMAFQRASPTQQAAAVPVLLRGIAGRPAAHQDMLLRCALQGLLQYGSPRGVGSGPEEQQLAATYSWLVPSSPAAAAGAAAAGGAAAGSSGAATGGAGAGAGSAAEAGEARDKAEAADGAGTGLGAGAVASGKAAAAPSADLAVWLEFCKQVMLLPASLSAAAAAVTAGAAQGQGGAAAAVVAAGAGGLGSALNAAGQQGGPTQPPLSDHPGLSLNQLHRVLGPAPSSTSSPAPSASSPAALNVIPPEAVAQRKVAVLNFLAAIKTPSHACYLLWLVAATDSNERVNRRGEELMKRHGGAVDLEDDRLVAAMMKLYQGSPPSDLKQPLSAAAAAAVVPAASAAVKLRLVGAFVRSIAAANAFPGTLHVIFDAIYGAAASTRSKQLGMEFAVWVFKHAKEERLRPLSPVILSSLLKLLSHYDAAESLDPPSQQLQAFTYRAIAQLAERCPFLVRGDATMCERMFGALEACDSSSLRVVMQDALLSLATAYKGCTPKVLSAIEKLLLTHCSSPVEAARYCALQWTIRLLSLSSPPACFLALLAAADSKTEIKEAAHRFLFPEADSRSKKPSPSASSPSPLSTPSAAFTTTSSSSAASSPPPPLSSLLAFICKQKPKAAAPVPVEGEQSLLLPPAAFLSAIRFLLLCWREERRGRGKGQEGQEGGTGVGVAGMEGGGEGGSGGEAEKAKGKEKEIAEEKAEGGLEGGAEVGSVEERLCVFVEHGFARDGTWEVHAEAGRALLEIVAAQPQLSLRFASRLPWLHRFLTHSDPSVRAAFAKLLGVVAKGLPAEDAHALLQKLQEGLAHDGGKGGIKEEEVQGLIAALGYVTATAADATGRASSVDLLLSRLLSPSSSPSTLALTAQALGLIGLTGPLPLPSSSTSSSHGDETVKSNTIGTDGGGEGGGKAGEAGSGVEGGKDKDGGSEKGGSGEEEGRKKRKRGDVVEQLASLLSHRDDKVVQSAAAALGMMSYGDPQGVADAALTALLTLARCKNEATLLAAGEALAFVWGPVDSPPFRPALLLAGPHSSLAPIFNDADDAAAAALEDKARRPKQEAGEGGGGGKQGGEGKGDVQMADASREGGEAIAVETEGKVGADVVMGEGQESNAGEERVWGGEAAEVRWEWVRRVLVDELLVSSRSEERCAAAVWLMSLLSFCGHHASLQRLLPQLQEAFSSALGDSNELTQEMASRAMSRIYTLGDAATKELLVAALVANLTGAGGKKRSGKLLGDTEVFTEDSVARNTSSSSMRAGAAGSSSSAASAAAGRTQSSVGVSTYRELCSVATDMGQPDLIYRLMDIANHHAALNSNRGAAFSFAAVAAEAGAALEPHLPALLPRLLRMMYDPNRPLAEAAGHIWRALVREPKATVDKHFDGIVEDLLGNVTGRLWRNREAACLALADLLPSRRFAEVSKHLQQVWVVSFRACDDIKDSVRTAGEKLCRAATSLTVRLCDPTLTPRADARAACGIVLPVLLAQGMTSSVASVRHLALSTTAKLAKNAGPSVRPHLAALVPAMLEALSGLEDQNLNYAEQHAERVGISSEKLEAVRLAMSRDTPMWHTLDACLQQVDESCLPDLLPVLKSLTRSSVGLNTRVGVARFISLLIPRIGPSAMRPHAPAFLKTLSLALFSERTSAGRRAFAAAAADMAKCAGGPAVERVVGETCARYLGEEAAGQKDVRLCCALLLRDVGKACPDDMPPCHHVLLPTLLLGRYDEDEAVRAVWEEAWDDVGVAASAAVREHAGDIAATLTAAATASSWTRRCQAAAAMEAVVKAMGADTPHTVLAQFLSTLLPQLPGRLWEGKEQLLPAIAAICTACPSALLSLSLASQPSQAAAAAGTGGAAAEVVAAVLAACGRNKAAFRLAALQSLHKILQAFSPSPPPKQPLLKPSAPQRAAGPTLDVLPLVAPGLIALFPSPSPSTAPAHAPKAASIAEPAAAEARATTAEQQEALLACVTAALLSATPTSLPPHTAPVQSALCALLSSNPVWTVKLAALNTSATFLSSLLKLPSNSDVHQTVAPFLPIFIDALTDTKRSQTRQAAVGAIQAATECLQHHSALEPADRDFLVAALRDAVKVEKSEAVKSAAEKCLELLGGMVE